jgi:hypothetical protein
MLQRKNFLKKKKIAQKHLLLGNALLTNKVSSLIYISSTKRGGVETVAQNGSKMADMWLMKVNNVRYMGAPEQVFGGLEAKMLKELGHELQPVSFMDGPTKANMVMRVV